MSEHSGQRHKEPGGAAAFGLCVAALCIKLSELFGEGHGFCRALLQDALQLAVKGAESDTVTTGCLTFQSILGILQLVVEETYLLHVAQLTLPSGTRGRMSGMLWTSARGSAPEQQV